MSGIRSENRNGKREIPGQVRHVPTHADKRRQSSGTSNGAGLYIPTGRKRSGQAGSAQSADGGGRQGKRSGGGNKPRLLLLVILAVIAAVIIFGVIRLKGDSGQKSAAKAESGETQAGEMSADDSEEGLSEEGKKLAGIRKSLENGTSVIDTLRLFYPDYLVVYNGGSYVFEPVNNSLKKHSYKAEEVEELEDGRLQYVKNGKTVSEQGIDVSSHQGEIDWAQVKNAGVDFAMIRALYRGYESGKLVEDKMFRQNLEGASANDIRTGVYVFTQAITEEEVDEEIEMLKGLVGSDSLSGPAVIDVEEASEGQGRMDLLTKDQRTQLILYYVQKLKDEGYTPMLYLNLKSAVTLLDLSQLENVDKWLAYYDTDFYYPYNFTMWQYSDKGRIDGIEGDVDLDLNFAD